jgi:hypothetical protein
MQLTFSIDGTPAVLNRNWFTAGASLVVGAQTIPLASPWDPFTHFSLKLSRTWHVDALGHHIAIEKIRPPFFAGFLPHTYRVQVDGKLIAEQSGY